MTTVVSPWETGPFQNGREIYFLILVWGPCWSRPAWGSLKVHGHFLAALSSELSAAKCFGLCSWHGIVEYSGHMLFVSVTLGLFNVLIDGLFESLKPSISVASSPSFLRRDFSSLRHSASIASVTSEVSKGGRSGTGWRDRHKKALGADRCPPGLVLGTLETCLPFFGTPSYQHQQKVGLRWWFCHFFHAFPCPGLGAAELLAGANPAPPCRWLTALEEEGIGGKDSPGMMGF